MPARTSAISSPLVIDRAGVRLAGEQAGSGVPVALLHGLTATRRYVVMGSRALERSGHRVIAYDARGHGESTPAPAPGAYEYEDLAGDLAGVLDELEVARAVLVGASMGAHTALGVALAQPERVAALVLVTPAYDPERPASPESLARWDRLAAGLREGGVEGFLAAYGEPEVAPPWRDAVGRVLRQRLSAHRHPLAVADALQVVPRSRPFRELAELERISAPTLVVGSRDESDPGHPLAVARAYAGALPRGRLVVEEPGRSPLAWRGGQLSGLVAETAARALD